MKKEVIMMFVVMFVCGFMYYSLNFINVGKYNKDYKTYNDTIYNLKEKKKALEDELKSRSDKTYVYDDQIGESFDYDIYSNTDKKIIISSTVIIIDDNKENLNKAINILNQYDYHGLIALSKNNLMERENNCIDKEEIDSLLEKGYQTIAKINEDESVKNTYEYFIEKGYEIKGFYFTCPISESNILELKEIEDNIAIFTSLQQNFEELNVVKTYGYKHSGIKKQYINSINETESIALLVEDESFEEEKKYDEEQFKSMLKEINKNVENNNTKVCNVDELLINKSNKEEVQKNNNIRIDEIKNEIENIGNEIINLEINN